MKTASLVVAAAITVFHAAGAQSQTAGGFPARPVHIVVGFTPGGNNDLVARAIAQKITEGLGQQVVVENRPSASGLVGSQLVAKSIPDGYTLLHVANTFAMVPSVLSSAGYDPLKDFTGVTLTALSPKVLDVTPALPVRSVKELIALAKARPGALSYASAGIGSNGHMAIELFSRRAGIKMLHVPYKGSSQAIIDVIGGQVMMMFDEISTSLPYIRAGKLRALAVTSLKRSLLFPNVPTIDEAGLRGVEDITFTGLMAPAGTPREALARVQAEVAKAVRAPDLRKRFLELGVDLTASASPEDFTAYVKAEFERKGKLAREAGIKME